MDEAPPTPLAQLAALVAQQLSARPTEPPTVRTVERATERPVEKVSHDSNARVLVGIGGGVAVGKSTVACHLAELLGDGHGIVAAIVASDGFLLTNVELAARGITDRKGFPESYDSAAIEAFLVDARAGDEPLAVPMYDHLLYEVHGERRTLPAAPVVIFEGVNALQFSERFDVCVYVDAAEPDMRRWFVQRVLALRTEAAGVPGAYLAPVVGLDDDTVGALAEGVWEAVNLPNLMECIEPTRSRADVVVVKGPDHSVREVVVR